MKRLGVIGCGGIADVVLTTLAKELPAPLDRLSLLVPAQFTAQAQALLDRVGSKLAQKCSVHTDIAGLLASKPDVVAECASHVAVRDYGETILKSGCDLVVISIGCTTGNSWR